MWQRLGICVRNKKDNTHLCDSSWFYAVFYVRCLQFLARLDEVQKSLCTTPALALAFASTSTFTLEFLKSHIF